MQPATTQPSGGDVHDQRSRICGLAARGELVAERWIDTTRSGVRRDLAKPPRNLGRIDASRKKSDRQVARRLAPLGRVDPDRRSPVTLRGRDTPRHRAMESIAETGYAEAVRRLTQVHGEGTLPALTFLRTLEEPSRFPQRRRVGASLGRGAATGSIGRGEPPARDHPCRRDLPAQPLGGRHPPNRSARPARHRPEAPRPAGEGARRQARQEACGGGRGPQVGGGAAPAVGQRCGLRPRGRWPGARPTRLNRGPVPTRDPPRRRPPTSPAFGLRPWLSSSQTPRLGDGDWRPRAYDRRACAGGDSAVEIAAPARVGPQRAANPPRALCPTPTAAGGLAEGVMRRETEPRGRGREGSFGSPGRDSLRCCAPRRRPHGHPPPNQPSVDNERLPHGSKMSARLARRA